MEPSDLEMQEILDRLSKLEARVFREKRISPEAHEIYGLYPLKKGRPAALKAIQKCLDSGVPVDLLRQKTGAYRDARLAGGSLEYTPNPATWFNQERYNDPPETWVNRQTLPSNPRELRARLSRLQDDYRMTNDLDQRKDISEQINNVKKEIQEYERRQS
jgi:hypothetical protein